MNILMKLLVSLVFLCSSGECRTPTPTLPPTPKPTVTPTLTMEPSPTLKPLPTRTNTFVPSETPTFPPINTPRMLPTASPTSLLGTPVIFTITVPAITAEEGTATAIYTQAPPHLDKKSTPEVLPETGAFSEHPAYLILWGLGLAVLIFMIRRIRNDGRWL